ncbi:hypothetical protein [Microvirga tunisiensis]|uniref:Uncharacterized protein n=1 Tax=Microvirga tunisiensis TaxID=2108360 RepID=A0A5N7MKB7_9HYPH|nr:hypothetical protein [Microvirga tunisiensis]MPR09286.1 hypothetical protein [Microvirga tunisiensis]MPR27495.1 hypothetical protein [Microvirga tunisiensis]
MSVTISAALPCALQQYGAPQPELELTRAEVVAIITAINETARSKARILLIDDFQCGYVAIGIHPSAFAEIAQELPPKLHAKISLHMDFAVQHNQLVSVYTNDDLAYCDARPGLRITGVAADDPRVKWCGGHVVEAFQNVGIPYNPDSPNQIRAQTLRDACERRLAKISDIDTACLYEIADYALSNGGSEAFVIAA